MPRDDGEIASISQNKRDAGRTKGPVSSRGSHVDFPPLNACRGTVASSYCMGLVLR